MKNVQAMAAAGVDRISIGALTHSAPAADLSLVVTQAGLPR
jgi:nicotinate-nucleotide pyrophosphorylase (carboxylating)